MRLLEYYNDGKFSLTEFFDNIPSYAILSHTWGLEEVTFKDMIEGNGRSKTGFDKIRFCGEQARRDHLQYFWVDTCCINKSNAVELQEAINSMFRWYQNAAKCYVYLSDVSTKKRKASDPFTECTWEPAFRSSKWFPRGWTLQELLAPGPGSVEFFSQERDRLGDKRSLEQQIHEITRIPISALRGTPLSQFDVNTRLLWAENRQTTREEDKIYSLFGIFDIQIPLLYGEGRDKAFKRLREEIDKPLKGEYTISIWHLIWQLMLRLIGNTEEKFVLDRLRFVDNAVFDSHEEEHNARCYQGTRVELLRQIDIWASDRGSETIFWLNGMAGTGKSTISRTVAQNFAEKGDLGASFFFRRGEGDRGRAGLLITTIAVQLVQKFPSLAPHVRSAIEADFMISRKALQQQFDTLILHPLGKIQIDPPKSSNIVIVIDALDECDGEEDVRIIVRLLSQAERIASVQLKFFLTSRPELPIRLGFEDIRGKYKGLILHQVPEPVFKKDISAFLEHELAMIRDDFHKSVKSSRRQLPDNWPGPKNVQILVEMAFPLFIFAATVCRFINDRRCGQPDQQLAKVLKYQTKSQASKLGATYLPVLDQLLIGVTGSEKRDIVEKFKQVVGSIVVLASPLSATSLDQLLGVPKGTVDSGTDLLHSVLSIPSDSNYPIRLLHLSFRDFLVDTKRCEINPFWVDENQTHQMIANCCIRLMSSSLKQNICGLESPGILKTEVASSRVDQCLPPEVKYACLYWIQHLQKSSAQLDDHGKAHQFLQAHLIHWLEALGWMGKTSEAIQAILSLEAHVLVSYLSIIYRSLINLSLV
jgi:hypothetical protein